MAIVTEAKSALHKGTSAMRSTVRHRPRAMRRLARFAPEQLMRRVSYRQHATRRRGRVPILPIVFAVGASAAAIVVVRRFVMSGACASEEAFPVAEENVPVQVHA